MGLRLFTVLAVLASVQLAVAHDRRPVVHGVVHEGGICWDPDVEYPVACEEDGD